MLRRAIRSSLRFRVAMVAGAIGLVLFGTTQLRDAAVDVYPEFAPLQVEVQTEALGLAAAEVEQLITVPLEADLLNGVAWVTDIRSASVPGLSSITLTFEPGTSLYRARQVVQERLAQAHAIPNVSKPPQMLQPVSSTNRVLLVGLSSSDLSLIEISQLARWTIKPHLMGVEGVANVASFGQRERQLQVHVDPQRLNEGSVTLLDVVETTGNALWVSPLSFLEASTPGTGGFIESPAQRLGVRHVSPIESEADLAAVAVTGKDQLRLGDISEVVEDHQPLIGDALVNSGPGLILVVEKLRGANTVEVAEGVEHALEELRPGLPGLLVDTSIYRPADYVDSAASSLGVFTIVGLGLLILVLALAFLQWRLALVTVIAVVASLAAAGLVVDLLGQSFNAMTVAGLAAALGVVVGDAVAGTARVANDLRDRGSRSVVSVIVESTLRLRGVLVYAAIFVLLPLAPVLFSDGLFGAFGRPLTVAYSLGVLASLAVSLLVTPALTLLLLPGTEAAGTEARARLGDRYSGLLERFLLAPRWVLAPFAVVALIGVLSLPQLLRSELPTLEERDLMVELRAAPGISLTRMTGITSEVTGELLAIPGVRNVASHTGRAVTGDQVVDVNESVLWVSLDSGADRSSTAAAVEEAIGAYPELAPSVGSFQHALVAEAAGEPKAPIVVRVYGNEQSVVDAKAAEVGQELSKIDGVENLRVETPETERTLEVEVDLARASQLGVKPGDVRRTAAILLSGIEVGQLFYDQKVFEVVVWGSPATRESTDDVRNLLIDVPSGGQVRLQDVADVRMVDATDVIQREGVFLRTDITAAVSGRSRVAVASDVEEVIESISFPLEYRAELLADSAEKAASERRLVLVGAFAAVAMLLLLQACFGSWRLGAALFLSIPAALAGGLVVAFVPSGAPTLGAVLGLLAVMAIATRNGILLVKRCQELERREEHAFGVTLVLSVARERLWPMLTTAAGVVVVFVPLVVLSTRPGTEILRPMGATAIAGLVTATAVSLFVVPALYLHLARARSETELDVEMFEEELVLMDALGNLGSEWSHGGSKNPG